MHTGEDLMNYEIVSPRNHSGENIFGEKTLPLFDAVAMNFIDALSKEILASRAFRTFPELIALAYWTRKSHLARLKISFEHTTEGRTLVGRGLVFQIAPSNVDTLFVYSWFLSMLSGNTNIVRISTSSNRQLELLLHTINKLCEKQMFEAISKRFEIIRYEYDDSVTEYFSLRCDVRLIWGGDTTVNSIRRIPLRPGAAELTFPDRFSLCLINADEFLKGNGKGKLLEGFYNDTYWFGQMACASPRLVCWVGGAEGVEEARTIFWRELQREIARKRPALAMSSGVDKLVAAYSIAMCNRHVRIEEDGANMANRIFFERPGDMRRDVHCGGGLFYEMRLDSLERLAEFAVRKDQTVSVFGFSGKEIKDFILEYRPEGIDRFVAIGKALDFSPVWDGHDLLREFCREIEIDL
jgi:Acyl-CoA reductase (LuxC)